jgi:hypothetical protein
VTQPLHTSQLIKNLGNTRIAYKPRHTHTHTHPETLEAREKPRWQLVSQLLTDNNTQGGPKYQNTIVCLCVFYIGVCVSTRAIRPYPQEIVLSLHKTRAWTSHKSLSYRTFMKMSRDYLECRHYNYFPQISKNDLKIAFL